VGVAKDVVDPKQRRDPDPEMAPYRADPGLPATGRPSDFPEQVWPPPNPNAPDVRRPEWAPGVDAGAKPGLFTGRGGRRAREKHRPLWEVAETPRTDGASMCECATVGGPAAGLLFWQADANLIARFDGGQVTSDGGLPWVARADEALGLCAALAACVPEWRRGGVRHSLVALVRQRVFQIACGYADQNDAATLRSDPLLKVACGRLPASEADLASQPTLSRLENAVDRHAVERLAEALADLYIRERGRDGVPAHILLDLDGTADPARGEQEGVAYHGYYRQHMGSPAQSGEQWHT
jgi:hypothetical protein